MSPMALMRRIFSRTADEFRVDYQSDADLLFAWSGEPRATDNVEVEPGIYVRVVPGTQEVVGIEVIDCARRFHVSPESIDSSFVAKLVDRFRDSARVGLSRTAATCAAR
jgi:hypothetical protein